MSLDEKLQPAYPRNPKTFGEKVKKVRMERGLFMREFAEMVGVAEATILNWERRGMVPAKNVRSRVDKFLNNAHNGGDVLRQFKERSFAILTFETLLFSCISVLPLGPG